jgi:adenine-specific DNA-methyltransferase
MIKNTLKDKLNTLLKKDGRLWDKETKELNQTLLKDLIDKLDEKLIKLLLSDKNIKNNFFIKVDNAFVFNKDNFKFFIDENKIDNSYTKYRNKIGLSVKNKFLSERNEVVLNWPFKDCVLEGGMTKEDQKSNEIFFNEVLAKDEIDRLFDSKALTNFIKHVAKGEEKIKNFKRNGDGIIKNNLVIKGNNLLSLHSLKEQFEGKIKLIYIDPPYNTGGSTETFTYNNSFNHSTWLTFMKNRLEVAKDFLRDDGFVAITIDHNELFYLGTLADEVFGRDNLLGVVNVVIRPQGRQFSKFFSATTEYMLVYSKKWETAEFRSVVIDENVKENYDQQDEEGSFKYVPLMYSRFVEEKMAKAKEKYFYPIYVSKDLKNITLTKKEGYYEVFPINNKREICWKVQKDKFRELLKSQRERYKVLKEKNGGVQVYEKFREGEGTKIKTHWIGKRYNATTSGTGVLKKLMGDKIFSYPKSLYAVLDTLKIMTSKEDVVMDFFAGSGTTGHATLELNKEDGGNRQFILIEQLDTHLNVIKKRLKKVLEKSNSKESFVSLELMKWNEEIKEKILNAKNLKELVSLFDEIYEKYFLNYNVKTKEFKEKTLKEEGFKKLSLDKQKKLFVGMLDMNQMYINFSERNDKKYNLKKEDIELSEKFYNKK